MNWSAELSAIAEEAASNPKVTAMVATTTTSLGIANLANVFDGLLSWAAVAAGLVATVLLARVHFAKYKNEVVQNKILRLQLKGMGGDPDDNS